MHTNYRRNAAAAATNGETIWTYRIDRRNAYGEYPVKFYRNGVIDSSLTSYASDREDARGTGIAECRLMNEREPVPYVG